ncbi:MAG: hypothetical protein MUC49_19165 [Raineya sp.]|jgi:hypothetical protein|nr:hypothetical protein [Raineya sp.]
MKNQFLAFLMLTVMFWGCNLRKDVNYTAINPETLEQAKLYFENEQKTLIPSNVSSRTGTEAFSSPEFRTFTPLWDKTVQTSLTNGNRVLITPVSRAMYVQYPNNLYFIRRLRTELNSNGRPIKAHIVELVTTEAQVAGQKEQIITNFFTEIETRTNARLTVFDIGYNFVMRNRRWQGVSTITENETCYSYTSVLICNMVTLLQAEVPCPSTGGGVLLGDDGNPESNGEYVVESCGGGSGGGNPDPPAGGGGPPPSDIGQDDPYIFGTYDYNGLKLDSYYFKYGTIKAIDEKTVETVKEVIDDPDFRDIISAYLGTGEQNKIHIIWKEEGFFSNLLPSKNNGYFDPNTNKIYLNPSLIKKQGRIGIVKTLIHEGIHASYHKPDAQELEEYNNMKNWLNTDDSEHITHNCMSFHKVEIALRIMKRFDRGTYGSWDSRIKDVHLKGFFLVSTLGDLDANGKPLLENKAWDILSPSDKRQYVLKMNELIKIYQQLP